MKDDDRLVTVRVPAGTRDLVKSYAPRKKKTLTELVNEILLDYVEGEMQKEVKKKR